MSPDAVSASQRARAHRGSTRLRGLGIAHSSTRLARQAAECSVNSCRCAASQPVIAAMNLALRLRVISTATPLWFCGLPLRETAR